jgi:hypothetical protein
MSAAASDLPVASDVMVAQAVLDKLDRLAETDPDQAEAVARAIQTVGRAKAAPIRIDLPNGPRGAKYMALAPSDPDAPVIIYRALIPGVDNRPGWLVTTLLPPSEYQRYREAERSGLLDDPAFQKLMLAGLAAAAAWFLSRSGKPPGYRAG